MLNRLKKTSWPTRLALAFAFAITAAACQSGGPAQSDCEAALERRARLAVDDSVSRKGEHRKQIADATRKSFLTDCESRDKKQQQRLASCLAGATDRSQANRCR